MEIQRFSLQFLHQQPLMGLQCYRTQPVIYYSLHNYFETQRIKAVIYKTQRLS